MEKGEAGTHEKPIIARELWFREEEKELIAERHIITTVRAGDRTAETADPKGGYHEGGFITLQKILQKNRLPKL